MGTIAQYKKYKRGIRQANVETDFSSGMMYSDGTIPEGYVKTLVNFDFTSDGKNALKPRAGYRIKEFLLPDMSTRSDDDSFLDSDVALKYSKECVEDGANQRQFIFGHLTSGSNTDGEIWVVTSPKSDSTVKGVDYSFDVAKTYRSASSKDCKFYSEDLTSIHVVKLSNDAKTAFPVGTFLKNSFYFFDTEGKLCCTKFDANQYIFDTVTIKDIDASEAVQYGYNMLASKPYSFIDRSGGSSVMQMLGILPYSGKTVLDTYTGKYSEESLMMTPRANTRVWFKCNYDIPTDKTYNIVWSWKELSADEWTVFYKDPTDFTSGALLPPMQADLVVPAKEIMIRCEAYNKDTPDVVEKAMTVGFDFSVDENNTTSNIAPDSYDLSTANGMTSWKNRLVLWGLAKDPTVLWISDIDEPGYFPYPNNITVFDEPIISVIEFMGSLVVFTNSKVYQVSISSDGISFESTVIQSNLFIEPWDKHLIQAVRNLIYFKSGNYYYMIVPKAQSTTGELTLAPITTPITDFFNNFSINVSGVFKHCYGVDPTISNGISNLVTYYNFLDYEFIHNFYVYKFNQGGQELYIHFDITYNTVARYWKICVYEAPHLLYPFRNDATQRGLIAATSVIKTSEGLARVIQIFENDDNSTTDLYFPSVIDYTLNYNAGYIDIDYPIDEVLELPSVSFSASDEIVTCDSAYIRKSSLSSEVLELLNYGTYVDGFDVVNLADTFTEAAQYLMDNTTFSNKQFLDTGYRDAALFINKRYRELQLQINNFDDVDMEFGMDFDIAGEPRGTRFKYETSQVIDEIDQDEAIVYLDAIPYMPVNVEDIDKSNLWTIHNSLTPNIDLYKVRASISGKGPAPRMRLYTRKQFNYQLLGLNWIYREMNMR